MRFETYSQYCWHPAHRETVSIDYFTKHELAVMKFPMCQECERKSDAIERELTPFGKELEYRGQL